MIWDGTYRGIEEVRRVHPNAVVSFMTAVERTLYYTRVYQDPLTGGPVLFVYEDGVNILTAPKPLGVFLPGEDVPDKIEAPVMVTYL